MKKYEISVVCENCDWECEVSIPLGCVFVEYSSWGAKNSGYEVSWYKTVMVKCPYCGCAHLRKNFKKKR